MQKRVFLIFIISLILINPVSADIVINEIMYDSNTSQGDDSDLEWIELYNNGASAVNLSNWKINEGDFDVVIIAPGEYLVIARELVDGGDDDNDSFETYYGNGDGGWNLTDATYNAIDGSFILVNSGDIINITNGTDDAGFFNYTNLTLFGGGDGRTLEKIDINGDDSDANWQAGAFNGTPGDFNNQAPSLSVVIPDFTWPEDTVNTSLNLSQHFIDLDAEDLNWSFIPPANITITINNDTDTVTMNPDGNFTGLDFVVFIADDGVNATGSNNLTLNVTQVNDSPLINGDIQNLSKDEDFQSFIVDLTPFEIDVEDSGTNLDWSISGINTSLVSASIIDIDQDILAFSPVANQSGFEDFTLTLTDSGGGSISYDLFINITAINDPQILSVDINDTIWDEDTNSTIDLTQFFIDIDGDDLNFSYFGVINISVSIDNDTGIATLIPDANFSGIDSIAFLADDDNLTTLSNNITLNITEVNDPPYLNGTLSQLEVTEDVAKIFDLAPFEADVEDPGENLTWSIVDFNSTLATVNIGQSSDNLILLPAANQSGQDTISLNLSDSGGLSAAATIAINISAVNDAPSAPKPTNPANNSNVTSSTAILFWEASDDPDSDDLRYYVLFSDNLTSLEFNATITLTNATILNLADNTTYFWLVHADDGTVNSSNSELFQFLVILNNPPVIDSFEPNSTEISLSENSSIAFNHTSSDPDNDAISFSWYVDEALNATTQNFTYDPNLTDAGNHNLTLIVEDINNNTASNFWNITVLNLNRLPVIGPIESQSIDENSTITLDVNATDLDDETLTYSTNLTFGSIDAATGIFVWQPNFTQSGFYDITFNVSDGIDSVIFTTNITVINLNAPPTLSSNIPDQTWNEDTNNTDAFDLDNFFSDVDNDLPTYNFSGNISIIVSIDQNNSVSFFQPEDFSGIEVIFFTAFDGNASTNSNNLSLIVSGKNELPTIISFIPNQTLNEDFNTAILDLTPFENDTEDSGTNLDWSVSNVNTSLITASITNLDEDILTFTSVANQSGSTKITLTLTDSNVATVSQDIDLTITPINDAPFVDTFNPIFNDPKIPENGSQLFNITKSDIDSVSLTTQWLLNGVGVSTTDSYNFVADALGSFNVTAIITDGLDSAAKEWNITISDKPIASLFDGSTTDFATINLSSADNITLEKSAHGIIQFTDTLDFGDIVDLDNFVEIKNGVAAIDSNELKGVANKRARITLKNLAYSTNPRIFFSDKFTTNHNEITQICTSCNIISSTSPPTNNGIVIFDVDHFTSFRAGESGVQQLNLTNLDVCTNGVVGDLEVNIEDPDKGDDFSPGDIIKVEVEVDNDRDEDLDVKVQAVLFDVTEDEEAETERSDEIEIGEDKSEKFKLDLKVPNDIDEGNHLIIFIKAFEDGDEDENCNEDSLDIDIEREKHDVRIENFALNPASVTCNGLVEAKVEIENFGSSDEDDVSITIRNPELGLDQSSAEFDLDEADGGEETAVKRFTFTVPENAAEQDYNIEAVVTFDDGDETNSAFGTLEVSQCKEKFKEMPVGFAIGSVTSKDNQFSIPVELANMGEKQRFTLEIANAEDWAESASSSSITLNKGQKSTIYMYLKGREKSFGLKTATVNIKADNEIMASDNIVVNLKELDKQAPASSIILEVIAVITIAFILIAVLTSRGMKRRKQD